MIELIALTPLEEAHIRTLNDTVRAMPRGDVPTLQYTGPGTYSVTVIWPVDQEPPVDPAEMAAIETTVVDWDWSQTAADLRNPEKKTFLDLVAGTVADIDAYLPVADDGGTAAQRDRDHNLVKGFAVVLRAMVKRLAQID